MVTKNIKLVHLDLSETGLNAEMLVEFSKGLAVNKGLLGVHLSGNPGLTPVIISKIINKLSVTEEKLFNLKSFN